LQPGGRLVLTVWSGASPLFVALANALAAAVGEDVALRSLTPFTFNDAGLIESLLVAAGYHEVRVSRICVDREVGPAAQSIPREIAGNPIAGELENCAPAVMDAIVASVARELDAFRAGRGFIVPQESFLFVAGR